MDAARYWRPFKHAHRRHGSGALWPIAVVLAAVAGVALVLATTGPFGPGISPDSVDYIGAARDLLQDGDLKQIEFGSTAYSDLTLWPPLFPALIALFSFGPGGFVNAARLVNAVFYGATVGLAGIWLSRCRMPFGLRLPALIAVLLCFPLYQVATFAWSETIFSFFLLLTALVTARYWTAGTRKTLIAAAICAGLAALSRYVGTWVIASGGMIVLLRPGKALLLRIRDGVLFGLVSGIPIGLWMVRNKRTNDTLTGRQIGDIKAPWQAARRMPNVIGRWYSPRRVPNEWEDRVAMIVLAVVLVIVCAVLIKGHVSRSILAGPEVITLSVITIVYLIQIPYSVVNYTGDPMASRFLAPVAAPLLLLIFAALGALCELISSSLSGRVSLAIQVTLGVALAWWLVVPFDQVDRNVHRARAQGVGQFGSAFWANSKMMAYLRDTPPEGALVSNYSEAVAVKAGIASYFVGGPGDRHRLDELVPLVNAGPTYLVWINRNGERENRNSLADVQEVFDLTPYFQNDEGVIYLMRTRIP